MREEAEQRARIDVRRFAVHLVIRRRRAESRTSCSWPPSVMHAFRGRFLREDQSDLGSGPARLLAVGRVVHLEDQIGARRDLLRQARAPDVGDHAGSVDGEDVAASAEGLLRAALGWRGPRPCRARSRRAASATRARGRTPPRGAPRSGRSAGSPTIWTQRSSVKFSGTRTY